MQPAVAQRRGGGLRVVPVAAHHAARPQADLADLAGGDRPVVLVRGAELDAGRGPADRVERLVVVGVERGAGADAARLGRRVADRVGGAEPARAPRATRAGGDERAAHHDRLHRREVVGRRSRGRASISAICGATPPTLACVVLVRRGGARRRRATGRAGAWSCPSRRYHGQLGHEADVGELGRRQHRRRRRPSGRPVAQVDAGDGVELAGRRTWRPSACRWCRT